MAQHLAVLVEDNHDQIHRSTKLLDNAGFKVITFEDVSSATQFVDSTNEFIDLFVLDRRLPSRIGEIATDEAGDVLFLKVRNKFSDSRILIFTGYADVPMLQQALEGNNQLPFRTNPPMDRMTVLTKDQSLLFKGHLMDYIAQLKKLDDIEINVYGDVEGISGTDYRILRRIAYEYNAVSLTARSLAGGLTGARVWKCEIRQAQGVVANVVAKESSHSPTTSGSLEDLLPVNSVAATKAVLSGMMNGRNVAILQLAGQDAVSLASMLKMQPEESAKMSKNVSRAVLAAGSEPATTTLSELVAPLISWEQACRLMSENSLPIPSPSLQISISTALCHGDLHPANIMVTAGEAVMIDFDNGCFSSTLLDPVTLLISSLSHPDSQILGADWPDVDEISKSFGSSNFAIGHASHEWFEFMFIWITERKISNREFWGLVLGYSVRQLKYDDVKNNSDIFRRILALARISSEHLHNS